MDEEAFNLSLRKFLKKVGVTAQREIEQAVRAAIAEGRLTGGESLAASVTLRIGRLELATHIDGQIDLT